MKSNGMNKNKSPKQKYFISQKWTKTNIKRCLKKGKKYFLVGYGKDENVNVYF